MQYNPYGGSAAQLATSIVNAGPGASGAVFNDILRAYDYVPVEQVSPDQARELIQWAQRLRAVFSTPDLSERVRLVNRLLAAVAAPPYISQHDGRAPHFHYAELDAPLVFRLKAYTASGLAHAICDEPHRIGQCQRPGCGVVYVDTSRNGHRRFCTTVCANRTHVAEHRARKKAVDRNGR